MFVSMALVACALALANSSGVCAGAAAAAAGAGGGVAPVGVLLVGLIRTRRAPHSSVPCLAVGWRHLHQAFSDACERCEYLHCHLLGTIVLLLTALEGTSLRSCAGCDFSSRFLYSVRGRCFVNLGSFGFLGIM
jgi:hypothetical protein